MLFSTKNKICGISLQNEKLELLVFSFILDEDLLVRHYTTTDEFVKKVVDVIRRIGPLFKPQEEKPLGTNLIDGVVLNLEG